MQHVAPAPCSISVGKRLIHCKVGGSKAAKDLTLLDYKIALYLCGREEACGTKTYDSVHAILQDNSSNFSSWS